MLILSVMITPTSGIVLLVPLKPQVPGTLVHPQYGEMQGSIDGQVRITHSSTEGRMCRVSFQFVESGELSFPVAGMATEKRPKRQAGFSTTRLTVCFPHSRCQVFLILSRTMSLPMLPPCWAMLPMLSGWLTPACLPQYGCYRGFVCHSDATGRRK